MGTAAAMSPEKEQVTPLAASAAPSCFRTSGSSGSDEEDPKKKWPIEGPGFCERWWRACWCWVGLPVVAATVIIVVVGYAVYNVREPEMTINGVAIKAASASPPNSSLTIVADVSVKNRSPVTFYFDGARTSLYCGGELIGEAYGPPGRAGGGRTYRSNVTLEVPSDRLLRIPEVIAELASGVVEVQTGTAVAGHVVVFGLFRHHVDVTMNCAVAVGVGNQTILHQSCATHVRV